MLVARPVPVFRRSLRDSWRSLIGWVLGLAAAAFLYLPLYPTIAGEGQLSEIVNSLPAELVDTLGSVTSLQARATRTAQSLASSGSCCS